MTELTDNEIDRLLSTPIPGGSAARDWFLPHDSTERGLANVRDVVRRIVATARSLSSARPAPLDCVETGVPEIDQEGSFQNATLQGAGDSLAFSIATHLDIPDDVSREGEGAVAGYITEQIARVAAVGVPGLRFTVQIGPSRDAARASAAQLDDVPMVAIVTGTFSLGMTLERVIPSSEALAIKDDLRARGQMAQSIPVSHPSLLDPSIKESDGDVFVFFSDGYPGAGITAYGPFPDEASAEKFEEAHRKDDEYSMMSSTESTITQKSAPRG